MGRTGSGAQLAQLAKRVLLSGFLLFALLVSPHGLALDEGENYCLYSDASFQGEELCGSEGSAWLSFYWFKRTSSLKVRDGYEIVAFPRIGYWGGFQIFSGEHETLGDWNNRIASFYVRESQAAQQKACFYSRKNYRGRRFCTDEEQYWFPWFWDDRISSVSVPAGLKVTLYSRWFFRGNSLELTASTPDLGDFNNVTSSLDIEENSQGTDSDGDGVDDSLDLCPDTPLGEMVNEQGCSPSQLDSDNDGVTDDLDLCPGTLGGNQVDENGCSSDQLDTDNDGVTNDLDQCPATPAGEAVDAVGCSASQLDEDGDGVSDADDQCPNTTPGEEVNAQGCALSQLDTDNDGVNDSIDECPATPAGEEVNLEGCSQTQLDDDMDGVNNAVDQCPGTEEGATVNENGCALAQLDSDEDGVNDALDQCPGTPAGLPVNDQGCSPVQLDTDNDGVNDALDQCPATPPGEQANVDGCSPSQLDSDNDGVNDALDQCPATPSGEVVNADGCAPSQLDTDEDGVNDALDQCPDTPADETANAEGCALSQLDTDNDGVNDALDQCPATPSDETANADGCAPSQLDTDNDGVNDALDQCPATPSDETANAEGCAPSQLDSDNDGVNDALDQCPATPSGEPVNADGCASSQLDTDGDGVNDDLDQCPATPAGEPVNADGCSLTQLDTDGDGVNDATDQCPATPQGESVDAAGCALSQLDNDNDGVNDAEDQCPNTPEGDVANSDGCSPDQIDTDNDGTPDYLDAFPNDPTETSDLDGDGIGDNADTDRDGDGVENTQDAFPNDPTESADLDGDGIGDNSDPDRDGDGVLNENDAFPNDPSESADLDGDGIGDNSDPDIDGDGVDNDQDLFPTDPNESADQDGDGIGDNSDPDRDGDGVNNEDDYFPSDPNASSVPTVQITSPQTLITVGSSPIRVSGTVDDLDATIIINGVQIEQNSGSFEADVTLEEGANNIIVRAIDSLNHEGTATIAVSLDKTPPYITIQSPAPESNVYTDTISVSGLVNDIVRGTISEDEADVIVSGPLNTVIATVSNRSYLAEGLTLQEGANQITISATDSVGNSSQEIFSVSYVPQTGKVMELVAGQAQSALIQTELQNPLVVRLTENGSPVVDKTVIFRVTEGDGLLQPGTSAEGNGAVVQSDANGNAQVGFKLGSRAGTGNHKVTARAVGFDGEILFYHSATFGEGIQLGIIEGNNQRGAVRQPLPKPLTLAVTDQGANLIPNSNIEFEVTKGTGTFSNGEATYSTTTDMDGRASAMFTLGAEEGLDIQRVTARLVGSQATAGFTASGLMPGDPGQTSISGVVLDNQDQPMPDVAIRIEGSTRQAVTDTEGQFTITEAPVGPVHLLVEGSTTTREGEWPSLSYNIVTVPGADNPMAGPIYLVELDTVNAVYVGAEDTIVTHPDLPGFELEVKAGSVTFPDGSKEGNLSITRVNANKIPMPPPNGMQPQLIVTIQPHGAVFDPPARLTIPNTDGHPPLAEIEMYSYDHDLEEFVTIGLGTVSRDGSTIASNVGVGVVKAGWHCGSPPGGSGCCSGPGGGGACPDCQISASGSCDDGNCVPVDDMDLTVCKSCVGGELYKKTGAIPEVKCKECENGVEKNSEDGADCDDQYFCTSFDGKLPGPDTCLNGVCKGNDIQRVLLAEDSRDDAPLEVISALQELARPVPKRICEDLVITGSRQRQTWRECCADDDDFSMGNMVFLEGAEGSGTASISCSGSLIGGEKFLGYGFFGDLVIEGTASITGFSRKYFSECTTRDECDDVETGAQASGSFGINIVGSFITENFISVTGGGSAALTGAYTADGCGDQYTACFGPPQVFIEFTFLSGVTKRKSIFFQDEYVCWPDGAGPGPTQ